jgi:hypothetical protein
LLAGPYTTVPAGVLAAFRADFNGGGCALESLTDLGGPEASGACAPALESSLARGVCWSLNVTLFGRPGVGDAEPFVWQEGGVVSSCGWEVVPGLNALPGPRRRLRQERNMRGILALKLLDKEETSGSWVSLSFVMFGYAVIVLGDKCDELEKVGEKDEKRM